MADETKAGFGIDTMSDEARASAAGVSQDSPPAGQDTDPRRGASR